MIRKSMQPDELPGSRGEHEVQRRYGAEKRARSFYRRQFLGSLNDSMREFIARQEMVFISTADSNGECDCTLRAGLPGFVRSVDEGTLVYPEYRGNGVMASLGNISENAHVGMFFADFFKSTIGLHVNGTARLVENSELPDAIDLSDEIRADLAVTGGRKPERWVIVDVEEAYIHCSKHIPLLKKLDKVVHWGTDDNVHKGGDYFDVKRSRPV